MPRQCCEPICSAMFAVCATCDRGQRYCSELCRSRRPAALPGKRGGTDAHCQRQESTASGSAQRQ